MTDETLIHACVECGIGPCDCGEVFDLDDECGRCGECLDAAGEMADEHLEDLE